MSKGAKFSIFTLLLSIQIGRTKFSLILIRMIKLFYSVMSLVALVSIRTIRIIYVWTLFRSSPIFLKVMIIRTLFKIVIQRIK